MKYELTRYRWTAGLLCGLSFFVGSTRARADEVERCTAAASSGQSLRDAGELTEARIAFAKCIDAACPAQVRKDCSAWFSDVEDRIPSVVLRVTTAMGQDVTGAHVTLDGQTVDLTGKGLSLDPGAHTVVAEHGRDRKQVFVTLREGEVRRPVTVVFDPDPLTMADRSGRRTAAYAAFGGAGVLAVGAGIFGIVGAREWASLQSDCRPYCQGSDIDSARVKFIVADILLGTALVSATVGLVLLLTEPKAPQRLGLGMVRF